MKTYILEESDLSIEGCKKYVNKEVILKSDFDKAKEKFKDSLPLVLTDKKFRTLKEVLELAEECFESDEK